MYAVRVALLILAIITTGCEEKEPANQAGEEIPASGGIVGGGGGAVSSRAISAAPARLTLLESGDHSLTLGWEDLASNELIFELERCTGRDCTDFVATARSPLAANTVRHEDTGLDLETFYRYRLRSTNRNGSSAWVGSAAFPTAIPPNTGLVLIEATVSSLNIGWTPTGSQYEQVEIERCAGVGCTDFRPVFGSPFAGPLAQHTELGLTPGTHHRFRVRAVGAEMRTGWLESAELATIGTAEAAAPTDLALAALGDTKATFTWTDNASNELIYEVERCSGEGCVAFGTAPGSPIAANAQTFTATGLSPSTPYTYRVRANGAATSEWTTGAEFRTAPTAPTLPAATNVTGTSATLGWVEAAGDETGFDVELCAGAGCDDFAAAATSPALAQATSLAVSGLLGATTYRFRVRAVRDGVASAWATSGDFTTVATAPTGFTLASLTDTTLGLSWTDNAGNELVYEVERCAGSGCTAFAAASGSPLAANSSNYSASDLVPSTFYTYRVRAIGATGNSAWLVGSAFKSAPARPSALLTGALTVSSAAISWTDDASDETGFEVERCTGSACTAFAAVAASPLAAGALTHVETGLAGATTYVFRVRAVRGSAKSGWLTSADLRTIVGAASCATPTTKVIDRGVKGNVTAVGRGLHSDTKLIPGTRQPAIAYYDGSATGGGAQLKLAFWNGSTFKVESVAGDSRVAAGSATWVRLAFLSDGKPMVFWTTGGTTVKGAMRSAALGATGTWSAAVLDTVAGAASRALEVSVSPLDHVGLVYLTNSTTAGRARFLYCDAGCASLAGFTTMTAGSDTVEASNVIANFMDVGIGWCKHNSTTYYPAVVYPGNAGANIRYATCQGALSSCRVAGGWSGQATNVVATTGVTAKLLLDATVTGDAPKIVTRNSGNTLLQAFQMNQACNAAPAYTFTAGTTFGAATSGTAWLDLLKSTSGAFHVVTNLGATNVHYHNSLTTNFASTTWNTAGAVDTLALPAAGAGVGGADVNNIDNQIYVSYGGAAAPFNLNMGVVADLSVASSAASAVFYTYLPDLGGGIQLPLATGQTRNVAAAATADGRPGVAYVDNSVGAIAGAQLKYAFRDGIQATTAWSYVQIPNTSSPMAPSLAFDHLDRPWIAYYDAATFRYYLITNSASDGSGDWSFHQFPISAKTATATAPATDETGVAMLYAAGVANPVMVVLNSTAAGGAGVRAALFDPAIDAFTSYATVDALGASFGTRLTVDSDTAGNVVVAYYDLTTTRVKFNYTNDGLTWLGAPPQISAATQGREGLSIRLNPATGRPAVSYLDRANNNVYFNSCSTAIASCSSAANWSTTTVATALGVSGIAVANEQVLSSALTFSASGTPYVAYPTGNAATTQSLGVADNAGGAFATTALSSAPAAAIAGAAAVNFAMTGFNLSAVRTADGTLVTTYVGPNNWLYATTCGD